MSVTRHRGKTCCVCGAYTHPQPQDPNHDDGYGHCLDCLNNPAFYHKEEHVIQEYNPKVVVTFYNELPKYNAPVESLTSDDSHGKITEVHKDGRLSSHFTMHTPKASYIEWMKTRHYPPENVTEKGLALLTGN